jgi:ADP-L-glycero-D-manno-heptose 6-epimerase
MMRLFKSYRPDYKDGEQKRDHVYVKDCVEVMWWLLGAKGVNGVFNVGTGQGRSWNDLARALLGSLNMAPRIEYIEMPESVRPHYQYFTEAKMDRLLEAGCPVRPTPLEEGVREYVQEYLEKDLATL